MTSLLPPAALARLQAADDVRAALSSALQGSDAVARFVEDAAEYWATDDALSILEAQRLGDTVAASGAVSFTDTPWEACGAAVHATHETRPVSIRVDLGTGETTLRAA